VSNLPLSATEQTLALRFSRFGKVESVKLDHDEHTGASRRGAFVVMGSQADAKRAIDGLNLSDFDGRLLAVYKAVVAVPAR
jgi:RNA recognition motif-containing protein